MLEKARKILAALIEDDGEGDADRPLSAEKKAAVGAQSVAVAVSGGSDSMALLHFVVHCGLFPPDRISAVHVNHGIRGISADRDCAFVRDYCQGIGVPLFEYAYDVPALCRKSGKNLEAQAREVRYEAFRDHAARSSCRAVLTAHHASDNAETVLLHILRGCGIRGLCGMQIRSSPDGNAVRPFLTTAKSEIDEYVRGNRIPFVTDETNADTSYDRNFLRREIFPLLKSRWPECESALLRLSENARTLSAAAEPSADLSGFDLSRLNRGILRAERALFLDESKAGPAVFKAMELLGFPSDVYSVHVRLVAQLAASGRNGARIQLGQGVCAVREYDYVTFLRGGTETPGIKEGIPFGLEQIVLGGLTVRAEKISRSEAADRLGGAREGGNGTVRPKDFARPLILDAAKIPAGAVWRFRRPGDRFAPFGGGSKKLKEYLIDRKIPARVRDKLPLLCYTDTVIAVAGVQISDGVRLGPDGDPVLLTVTGDF